MFDCICVSPPGPCVSRTPTSPGRRGRISADANGRPHVGREPGAFRFDVRGSPDAAIRPPSIRWRAVLLKERMIRLNLVIRGAPHQLSWFCFFFVGAWCGGFVLLCFGCGGFACFVFVGCGGFVRFVLVVCGGFVWRGGFVWWGGFVFFFCVSRGGYSVAATKAGAF